MVFQSMSCGSKGVAATSAPYSERALLPFIWKSCTPLPGVTGASIPKMRWWTCTRCAPSATTQLRPPLTLRCTRFFLSNTSTTYTRTGWLPWQRPGFELAMMLRDAVKQTPDCDGIVLGGHGLFTWGDTQRQCYVNTITIIDQLGQFVSEHLGRRGANLFGGSSTSTLENNILRAQEIFPFVRGRVSAKQRLIGNFTSLPEVLRFVNSSDAAQLAHLGTSCPDHFIRTKIRPLFVPWTPRANLLGLREAIDAALNNYREEYSAYYKSFAQPDSPKMRDTNPTVVLIPGIGMFSFGKNRTEACITGEFYTNAIHVMEGATALTSGKAPEILPQAGPAAKTEAFTVYSNYVALPPSEAFRIEYWQLEEAKIRRQPPEKELSRQICLIVGGGNGVGRETAFMAADRGAHIVVADRDVAAAQAVTAEVQKLVEKKALLQ